MNFFGVRKTLIALATVGLVLAAGAYYAFRVVPAQQESMNSRGFRILRNMDQNIHDKKTNITRTIDRIYSKSRKYKILDPPSSSYESVKILDDTAFSDGLVPTEWISMSHWQDKLKEVQIKPEYDDMNNRWSLRFYGDFYESPDDELPSETKVIVYDYQAENFFKDIIDIRKDFFDEFAVLYQDKILYQTSPLAFIGNFGAISKQMRKKETPLLSDIIVQDTVGGGEYYVFCHPFDESSDLDLVLCGLVPVDKYNRDRYQIDTDDVIWIIFFFVIAVCVMPFIKMFTLTRYEHLMHSDVVKVGISLVAGASFVSLALLFGASTVAETERQSRELRALWNSIHGNFTRERDSIVGELARHDQNISTHQYDQWLKENKESPFFKNGTITNCFNGPDAKHYVKSLLAVNRSGRAWGAWLSHGTESPDLDLIERNYVDVFAAGSSPLRPNFVHSDGQQYFFQSIYSWQDQENTVMVSKVPSRASRLLSNEVPATAADTDLSILAMETKMFSLMHTALPEEMSFCIIDQAGNVLFHSQDVRNLRENLLSETDHPARLIEAIRTSQSVELEVKYYGRTHLVLARPIADMPYTLVTMYDKGFFLDALSNQLTFVMAALIVLALTIAFIFIVTWLLTRRMTYLKRFKVNLRWITKVNSLSTKGASALFVIVLVPLVVTATVFLFHRHLMTTQAFMFPVFVLGFVASTMYKMYRLRYMKSEYRVAIRNKYRIFFGFCGLVALAMLVPSITSRDLHYADILNNAIGVWMLIFLFLSTIEPDLLSFYKPDFRLLGTRVTRSRSSTPELDFLQQPVEERSVLKYTFIALSIMLLLAYLSAFPSLTFFITSMRQERQLMQKRNSIEVASSAAQRFDWLMKNYSQVARNRFQQNDYSLLSDGIYIYPGGHKSISLVKVADLKFPAEPTQMNWFDTLYLTAINKPNDYTFFDRYEKPSIFLYRNSDEGMPRRWSWVNSGSGPNEVQYRLSSAGGGPAGISVRRPVPGGLYQNLEAWQLWGFLALTVVVVGGAFSLVYKLFKNITMSEYFNANMSMRKEFEADKMFISQVGLLGSTNLLIISLPGTNVVEMLTDILSATYQRSYSVHPKLDAAGIHHELYLARSATEVHSIIVLPFLNLSLTDYDKCMERLSALAAVFEDKGVKVVWVTSSDPTVQISGLSRKIVDIGKRLNLARKTDEKSVDLAKELLQLSEAHENFRTVTGDFHRVSYALEDNIRSDQHFVALPYTSMYIEEEFRFGAFLSKLREKVVYGDVMLAYFQLDDDGTWINKFENADELFVIKIQDMAMNYYNSIWSHLSSEEKYVLYDLALDELTNHRNHDVLADLEAKGIIYFNVAEGCIKIFNRSFRNFILTVVDPEEALTLEREINLSSRWEVIRIVIFVILIGFVSFLFLTDQHGLNKTLGLFSAVTALGPTFLNFLTNFRNVRLGV